MTYPRTLASGAIATSTATKHSDVITTSKIRRRRIPAVEARDGAHIGPTGRATWDTSQRAAAFTISDTMNSTSAISMSEDR